MTIYLWILCVIGTIRCLSTIYAMGKHSMALSIQGKWPSAFGTLTLNCIIAIPSAYFLIVGV